MSDEILTEHIAVLEKKIEFLNQKNADLKEKNKKRLVWHLSQNDIIELVWGALIYFAIAFCLAFGGYALWNWSFNSKQTGNFYIDTSGNTGKTCIFHEIDWGIDDTISCPNETNIKNMSDMCVELHKKWKLTDGVLK